MKGPLIEFSALFGLVGGAFFIGLYPSMSALESARFDRETTQRTLRSFERLVGEKQVSEEDLQHLNNQLESLKGADDDLHPRDSYRRLRRHLAEVGAVLTSDQPADENRYPGWARRLEFHGPFLSTLETLESLTEDTTFNLVVLSTQIRRKAELPADHDAWTVVVGELPKSGEVFLLEDEE